MSVLAEFEVMLGKIGNTIENELETDIADYTKKTLQETMVKNVYSHQASPWAMSKRRGEYGGLADTWYMQATVTDVSKKLHTVKELQVESTADFQGIDTVYSSGDSWGSNDALAYNESQHRLSSSGARLDEVVETGNKAFHQPKPRPFYADTEKHVANCGAVTWYLVDGLIKAGFDVQVL